MKRRETFAAPLALAALAAPSIAGASPEREILRLYAEWKAARDSFNSTANHMDEARYNRAFADLVALEDAIISLPASTVAELAAKVLVADDGGDMATASTKAACLVAEMQALVWEAA